MSLPAQKSKNDYNKYLNSYLATLNQSIQNNDLVYNAVSANLAGDMMAVPQMPQDTRSVEDKLRDIENLKVQLQSQLLSLTDGKIAGEIVRELNDFEIQQAVQSFPSLYQTLKPIWSMGVPSVIFVQALRNLSQKQDLTAGIEMNLQQGNANTLQLSPQQLGGLIDSSDLDNLMSVAQSSQLAPRQRQGLLSQISYVKQLIFDKGDLPNRIERARQLEAASGQDQRIPASVQEYLIPKAEFGLLLQEIVDARMNGDERGKDRAIRNIMDYLTPPDEVVADMEDFKAQEGQAGAEETKGEEVYQPPSGRTYRTREQLAQAEAVEAEAEPVEAQAQPTGRITIAYAEGSFPELVNALTADSSTRLGRLRLLLKDAGDENRPAQLTMKGVNVSPEQVALSGDGNRFGSQPNTQKYWIQKKPTDEVRTNIKELYATALQKKLSRGSGLRRMSGRGVSFTIKEEPQTKPKSIKLKMSGVIEKEPSYVPFGRYAINKHKLASDIFMLRTPKGGAIPRLLTQKLSNKLSKIIKTIADKGTPSFEAIGDLETLDKEILHKILQESQISSISTPNPSRDQDEKDHRRFLILKGELISGNNNKDLIKELKTLIVRLMSKEILPRREAMSALTELALIETI